MINRQQQTLKSDIHCTGTGVHSNLKVSMVLRPARPDTGIVFRRVDCSSKRSQAIKALYTNVVDTTLCTTIGNGVVSVRTVEHLMAAMAGCGIDNAFIDLDGAEVPVMDGSAAPFVFLIECAGIVEQRAPRRAIEVLKKVCAKDGSRTVSVSPAENFTLRCDIDFEHAAVGYQSFVYDPQRGSFRNELSRARTFCMEEDVVRMQAAGFGLGGSLDNAVVVGAHGVLNEDGLRYNDEFVRHKALDCIGDLYLAGAPIIGYVHSERAGHSVNHALVSELLDDPEAWRLITLKETAPLAYKIVNGTPVAATA